MTKTAVLERHSLAASEAVAAFLDALASADPPPDVVARLVSDTRRLQRQLVAVVMSLTAMAKAHAAAGAGPPVEVVLRDGASVSEAAVFRDRSRARVAEDFPAVGRAIVSAEVFPENLDVLARITCRMTADEVAALAEHDVELAAAASRLGVDSFRNKVQRYRDRNRRDHGQTAEQQAKAEEFARVSVSRDRNMHLVLAKLDTMHGTVVLHVITDSQTLATGPHDHSIIETADGLPVCPETLGQIACDCVIQRVESLPDGRVNVSRISRTATATQKAALRALYDCCAISGVHWSRLEVHHVRFVSQGGKTELCNLIPISRRWHHAGFASGDALKEFRKRNSRDSVRLYGPSLDGQQTGTLHRTIAPPIPVLYRHDTHELAA